jgi:REP element-mobilizing transposase RayT
LFGALYLVIYFLTFVCYGTWLHGDESGSVDPRHNVPGHRLIEPNAAWVSSEQSRMLQEPYEMDEPTRACVLDAVLQHCEYRNWPLLAAHVRANHVHVIVDAPLSPEKVLNELKAYASRRLNQIGLDPPDRRRWARHGSTRYLWNRDDVEAAVKYVADRQGDPMAVYVNQGSW